MFNLSKESDVFVPWDRLISEGEEMRERTIRKAIKGNQRALVDCLLEMKDQLNRIGYGYFRQADFIDEALSRTTSKAIMNISTLKQPEYFKTWLIRIHINNCLDILKELQRFVEVDVESLESFDPQDYNDLYEAIQQLPQSYQTLINLRFFNELTLNEVAEVTAMSEPTVRRQIKKALALLRIELGDDSHE